MRDLFKEQLSESAVLALRCLLQALETRGIYKDSMHALLQKSGDGWFLIDGGSKSSVECNLRTGYRYEVTDGEGNLLLLGLDEDFVADLMAERTKSLPSADNALRDRFSAYWQSAFGETDCGS